jgi:hypothetical protein
MPFNLFDLNALKTEYLHIIIIIVAAICALFIALFIALPAVFYIRGALRAILFAAIDIQKTIAAPRL